MFWKNKIKLKKQYPPRTNINNPEIFWLLAYFCVCGLYSAMLQLLLSDTTFLENSVATLIVSLGANGVFLYHFTKNVPPLFTRPLITIKSAFLAIGCALLFFLLCDLLLDPFFIQLFPQSSQNYADSLATMSDSPLPYLLITGFITPIVEELLLRGYLLYRLADKMNPLGAICITSLLFALLHFNFFQTLSALLIGFVLGGLFVKTRSVSACILAHVCYNTLSFCAAIFFS